jgi:hypothetical protein
VVVLHDISQLSIVQRIHALEAQQVVKVEAIGSLSLTNADSCTVRAFKDAHLHLALHIRREHLWFRRGCRHSYYWWLNHNHRLSSGRCRLDGQPYCRASYARSVVSVAALGCGSDSRGAAAGCHVVVGAGSAEHKEATIVLSEHATRLHKMLCDKGLLVARSKYTCMQVADKNRLSFFVNSRGSAVGATDLSAAGDTVPVSDSSTVKK